MKITDKIHLLKVDFEISIGPGNRIPRFVNVIIILGEKITLIDSGVKGTETQISNYLKEFNRDLSELESIILSHSHPDEAVRFYYTSKTPEDLSACQSTIDHLGLPQFMVNPIVDKAFRSHIS